MYFKDVGRTYHFECPHCQYRARVSGGADDGVNCAIQTIVCHNCRELYDVFTKIRKRAPGYAESRRRRKLFPEAVVIPPMMLVQQVNREFQAGPRPRAAPPAMIWEKVKLSCPVSALHRD